MPNRIITPTCEKVKRGENSNGQVALGEYLRRARNPALQQRLAGLQKMLGMLEPVPEEWLKAPGGEKTEDVNSLTYLISLRQPMLNDNAYHGFVGDFLKAVAKYTEATDACILGHLISAVGSYLGPGPYVHGGNAQPARLSGVIVGSTSTGRKGTGMVPVDLLMKETDDKFWKAQRVTGLATGEGLINLVSDKKLKPKPDKNGKPQPTKIIRVEKRAFDLEPEFSKILMQTHRDGNILSQVIRESFDSGNLGVLTKVDPLQANGAHICIVGHITPEELKKRFSELEMANGFGNRLLWFLVKSDKLLPSAPPIPQKVIKAFAVRLRTIDVFAKKQKRVKRDKEAEEYWEELYPSLREDKPGLVGALTARGTAIVLRLALLYALLDKSKTIGLDHLKAALAVWQYSEESVQKLFKGKSGSSLADWVYRQLESGPKTTTQFHSHRNLKGDDLREALEQLEHNGRIRKVVIKKETGGGRPTERWERVS